MLSLLLALALTPDPQITNILGVCDKPKMSQSCQAYINGFVDAIRAQEHVSRSIADRSNLHFPSIACFTGTFDTEKLRARIVATLKQPSSEPARNQVLIVITQAYPCEK